MYEQCKKNMSKDREEKITFFDTAMPHESLLMIGKRSDLPDFFNLFSI